MTDGALRVVVVGGGIAGLTVADECARPGVSVALLESSDRLGGCVAAAEVGGLRVDVGAESFATRGGHVAALIDDLGLGEAVVPPNPAGAWLHLPDRSVPLPAAGLLGIPGSPLAEDVIAAIGWRGALRAYLDRLTPVLKIGQETNLGTLVRRRMGQAVLDRLVAPVVAGVYSADPDEVDPDVVAPGLNAALTRQGSLSGAVTELRSAAKAGSAVAGLAGGMTRLVSALGDRAAERGVDVRTGVAAERVDRVGPADAAGDEDPEWSVLASDGQRLRADAVVIAPDAAPALALLRGISDRLATAATGWPTPVPVDIVTLVLDAPALDAAPRGTGVLVAPGTGVAAKAMTHSTAKWAWLADAAGDRHVLRLSYGRAGDAASPDATTETAVSDAAALMNIPLTESDLVASHRTRWTQIPFAAHGQRDRIRALHEAAEELPSLAVTGAWLAGTGLASVVRDAKGTARRILGLRWKESSEGHGPHRR